MLRGTQVISGTAAVEFSTMISKLRKSVTDLGFEEIILPSIWNLETFTDKLGAEKEGQMWSFKDKGDRPCCLIPEATGVIQELWKDGYFTKQKAPIKIFYVARCYRYERPQAGRYREFTQFGVEILGGSKEDTLAMAREALQTCVKDLKASYSFVDAVKRGLSYYVEDGFEVECAALGAQKQVAGGGRYKEGIGWAVGVDRLLLAERMAS